MNDLGIFWNDLKFLTGTVETINNKGNDKLSEEGSVLPFYRNLNAFLIKNKCKSLTENLNSFIQSCADLCNTSEKQLELIAAGVAPLILFIQTNWTGPETSLDNLLLYVNDFESTSNILKQLVVDGENVISAVKLPELLFISKVILEIVYNTFSESQAAKIWYLRCLFIHQQILEELSPQVFDKITVIINDLRSNLSSVPKYSAVALYLEFSRIYMYYYNVQKSKADIKTATGLSGLEISLSGALGKRTKFQCEDLAQLILKVNIDNEQSSQESAEDILYCSLPKDVKLDDDVRLDKVKYVDDTYKYPDLTGLQQAVILGNMFQTQKSQPKDNLADEELQPLISCILDQPKLWPVRMTTLLLRSKLEATHKRTVERSMMQVQVLADSLKDPEVSLKDRFTHFFISYLPPKWDIQSTLANILLSMGSVKSALDIYNSLEDWENVIFCYNTLQMRHKAQEIIEQEISKNPTPKLWCLLGDATDDVSCYEKAWELSNKKSARSQRHWALFYYYRKNYAESIEHFQKSLEINSLQKELWYRLGYAALVEENWEISAHAYRRYCVLDPECFEAWNNLGRCYCELKQKYRAWKALQEALKVDYSNWKVWDNYMVVSSDLKAFDEVIKSYHEILNLKEKHVDVPVLNSVVVGFKNMKKGGNPESGKVEHLGKFKTRLLELFGRLTSQVINDPELWFLYSEVVDTDSPESLTKKHQLLMKAHRSAINKADWDSSLESCNKVIYVLSRLLEVGLLMQKPDVLMSCKLAASGAVAKIKKKYVDIDICESLSKNLEEIEKILNGGA